MEVKKEEPVILPFTTQTGLELANAAPEQYHGLVDDLLLEVGVSMLAAKPKTGKSTLLRQLAVAVAEGTEFFGKQPRDEVGRLSRRKTHQNAIEFSGARVRQRHAQRNGRHKQASHVVSPA